MIFSSALKRIGGNVSMRRMSWGPKAHVSFYKKDEKTLGLMYHSTLGRDYEYEATEEDINAIDWNLTEEV